MADTKIKQAKRPKKLNFDKWGDVFIAPCFVVFTVFSLIHLI